MITVATMMTKTPGIHASQVRTRIIAMMIIIVTNYGNDKDARYLSGIHASQVRTRIRE